MITNPIKVRSVTNLGCDQEWCVKYVYDGSDRERIYVKHTIEEQIAAINGTPGNVDAVPVFAAWMAADPENPDDYSKIRTWCRHDAYLSIVSGAKGIVVWSGARREEFVETYYDYFKAYGSVANDLNGDSGLGKAILFGEVKNDIEVAQTSGPLAVTDAGLNDGNGYTTESVSYMNIADNTGGRYLLVVNSADANVTIDITGLPSSGLWKKNVFDDSDYFNVVTGGEFSDSLTAYEVKCYRIISEPQNCGDEGSSYSLADMNMDCIVNLKDLSVIASKWMECTDPEGCN